MSIATALAVVAVLCALANAAVAAADFCRAGFVLANSAEVGVKPAAIPYLASLKLAGAVGIAAGFVVTTWLGLAASAGLVLFFIGAVGLHLHTRVLHNIAFPGVYLALAVGALGYFALRLG